MSSFAPTSKGAAQSGSMEYSKFDADDAVYFGGKFNRGFLGHDTSPNASKIRNASDSIV